VRSASVLPSEPEHDGARGGCSRHPGVSVWKAGHAQGTGLAGSALVPAPGSDSRAGSPVWGRAVYSTGVGGGLRPSGLRSTDWLCRSVTKSEPFSVAFAHLLAYSLRDVYGRLTMCRDGRGVSVDFRDRGGITRAVHWGRWARVVVGSSWLSCSSPSSSASASFAHGNSRGISSGACDGTPCRCADLRVASRFRRRNPAVTVSSGMTGRG